MPGPVSEWLAGSVRERAEALRNMQRNLILDVNAGLRCGHLTLEEAADALGIGISDMRLVRGAGSDIRDPFTGARKTLPILEPR